jgi:SAM-dependent methyltransferase
MQFERIKFWENPEKSGMTGVHIPTCKPEFYLDLHNISAMVVDVMKRHAKKSWKILEIGCGTGRNLVALKAMGFKKVSGIELSQNSVNVGRAHFPEYKDIDVVVAPVEEVIKDIEPVDVIFTSGLLMHLPPELDWVLEEVAKKAKKLIMTNEGEIGRGVSAHAWSRNYQEVFEPLGWEQVEWETAEKYPPLPKTTIKRVFVKKPEPVVEEDELEVEADYVAIY